MRNLKRVVQFAVVATLVCASMVMIRTHTAFAADANEQGFHKADKALASALASGDKAAAEKLLDDDFQWVSLDGTVRTKAETLSNLSELASDLNPATDMEYLNLGEVERVLGIHQSTRFGQVWVKRPAGWRALAFLDTPLATEPEANPRKPTEADKECDNPCKTLPYTPADETQRAAMLGWQKIKVDEWQANSEDWAKRSDPDDISITPRSIMTRDQHVASIAKQKELYGTGTGGAPVVWMRMWDFGNTAVLISRHKPNKAGKQNYTVRLLVNRDSEWKIILSIQNDDVTPMKTAESSGSK